MTQKINNEFIEQAQENFIFNEKIQHDRRVSLLTKINTQQTIMQEELKALNNLQELSNVATLTYLKLSSYFQIINEIYNEILELDNGRVDNIARLIRILKESNINNLLKEGIKEYD